MSTASPMQALIFDGMLRLAKRERPQRAPGEALIRVTLAGICHTDLELTRGYMGFSGVLGHEFVGVVEDCDDGSWVGRRVVGEINLACGSCDWCARGLGRHCPTRRVLGILNKDGVLAGYATLPVANLHAVPDAVDDEAAVFCEPLAAALEIGEQVALDRGTRTLVLGDGKLGLLCGQVLRQAGLDVDLCGHHAERAAMIQGWGLCPVFEPAALAPKYPLVIEATGTADGLALAMAHTEPRGTLVLKSTVATGAALSLAPLVVDEITVVGSRCGPFGKALDLLAQGAVDTRSLIAARYALSEGLAAFAHAARPGVLKVLVAPG
ncbi:MAG: alcohol dehydrogenase catalytic domain-containing protein [Pseudomonadota bacterium]